MAGLPVVLSIAGYDPSSGAGITADIKVSAALGCYAITCITALTVQSTQGVFGMHPTPAGVVTDTLERLADDFEIAAVRIGMLGSGEVAHEISNFLEIRRPPNIVLDPVLRSSSGAVLLDEAGCDVLRRRLLPLADVITPNLGEAAELAVSEALPADAPAGDLARLLRGTAGKLHSLGCRAVVITGGHLQSANDYLSYVKDGRVEETIFPGTRLESRSTHGTGCAFATAIACRLALGDDLPHAVAFAKEYVRRAIAAAPSLGKGIGPLTHFP